MLEDRFSAVVALIEEHNIAIGGKDNPGYVNPDELVSCVKSMGGTTEERLKSLSYEDIAQCLPTIRNTNIKPVILAKAIAKVFRGNESVSDNVYISNKKAERMTLKELVNNFNPVEYTSSIGKRLLAESKNEPFIVLKPGRTLNSEATFQCLEEIKKGFPGRLTFVVDGIPQRVYKIGELPGELVDENPMFIGRPLRPDGTCDQTNRSWNLIAFNLRQFIRIGVNLGEIKTTIDEAHKILDFLVNSNMQLLKLRERYAKVSIEFDRLESIGQLPTLKIPLGQETSNYLPTFPIGKKVL